MKTIITSTKYEDSYNTGIKFDDGKLDWTLLPFEEMESVIRVLMFGAKKYERDNWKKVDIERYRNAAMRHLVASLKGEKLDEETGESHMSHLICCALFILYKEKQNVIS